MDVEEQKIETDTTPTVCLRFPSFLLNFLFLTHIEPSIVLLTFRRFEVLRFSLSRSDLAKKTNLGKVCRKTSTCHQIMTELFHPNWP